MCISLLFRKPSGSSSIFLPCFSCSPPSSAPPSRLVSSPSVTVALRPGSREQLVCLPALLTTANLWREAPFTSLHTTHAALKAPLRVLPCSRSPILLHCPRTPARCCEFFDLDSVRERLAEEALATAPRLSLSLQHGASVISSLSTLADSSEGSACHPPTGIFGERQRRKMGKEGRVGRACGEDKNCQNRGLKLLVKEHTPAMKETETRRSTSLAVVQDLEDRTATLAYFRL